MRNLYRFSPIINESTLQQSLGYLIVELEKLSQELLGEKLPISVLKLFAHYPKEYEYLSQTISQRGSKSPYSSEKNLYVQVADKINGQQIKLLGVRVVDPYRMQVGCGDYEVEDFAAFRKKHLNTSPFIRDAKDAHDMLELWHPDYDVLGYIIAPLRV